MNRRSFRQLRILAAQAMLVCAAVAHADLSADIGAVLCAPEMRYALVGLHIVDGETGEELFSLNADIRMQPASNQKIITSAAARELLGADFTYSTGVYADAEIPADGVIRGPIYVKGAGDPALTSQQVKALAIGLESLGARRVDGPVIADDSAFSDSPLGRGWSWDYLSDYYAAGICALTVDGGCVKVKVTGAQQAGDPPVLSLDPPSDYLTLAPGTLTAESAARPPGIARALGRNVIELTGPIAPKMETEDSIAVSDPATYCATLFRGYLLAAGVEVRGQARRGLTPAKSAELITVPSRPASQLLLRLNKASDNNFAEAIFRTISLAARGVGSREASEEMILDWAKSIGADPLACTMWDGSGLSRLNAVTPRFLVQILRHMQARRDWVDTLPVMGQDGTLRSRLRDTPAAGRIRAKTGYISGVRALSGYLETNSGKRLIFSFLVNGALDSSAARDAQDKVCLLLADL